MTRAYLSSRRSSTVSNASKPLRDAINSASVPIEPCSTTANKSQCRALDYEFLASLPEIDVPFLVECNNFLLQFPDLGDHYIPIAKIGEGTFYVRYPLPM